LERDCHNRTANRSGFGNAPNVTIIVSDLEHELGFDQMNAVTDMAGHASRAEFGHAGVVEGLSIK
jgi:hypothetical protein